MKSILERIALISAVLFFFIPGSAFAETKTFIKEYTYQAGDEDSKNSSRTIALREVKRLLLEELGTYLESMTEVQNFKLTKDQITILTAGIVKTELVDDKWDTATLKYWIKAKITADSSGVIKAIDALRKDRQKTKELEELRKWKDESAKELERLRKELTTATGEKKKQDTESYNKNIKNLDAAEWLEMGSQAILAKQWKEALEPLTKAIELDPNRAISYLYRGYIHDILGNYKLAIADYNKAIGLNPKEADTYAYYRRGIAYNNLGNHKRAIIDFDKAIELDSKNVLAYQERGSAYYFLGKYKLAIANYDKAIELNPKEVLAYEMRGITYHKLKNYKQAITDYNKTVTLNSKNANVYYFRGVAHSMLGNEKQALNDYKTAARLGNKRTQEYLTEQGIVWDEGSRKTINSGQASVNPVNKTEPSIDTNERYKEIKGIVLMDGKVIEGQIISMNIETVKIRTKEGKVLSYSFMKEIKTFIKDPD